MAVIVIIGRLYGSVSLFQVHVRCWLSIRKEGGHCGLEGDQPRDINGECDNVFNHLRFVYIYLGLFNLTLSTWQQVCERHDINQPSAFYTCFTNLNIKIEVLATTDNPHVPTMKTTLRCIMRGIMSTWLIQAGIHIINILTNYIKLNIQTINY